MISPKVDPSSEVPLYRQLFLQVKHAIESGILTQGERLPATRELAGLLGLNRTTVSAAYSLLEEEGLIAGHVGRGSFVTAGIQLFRRPAAQLETSGTYATLPLPQPSPLETEEGLISFATSRPSQDLFPLAAFRETSAEVLASDSLSSILQLGSPGGYEPLRQHLLEEARTRGLARAQDDILITSGCQQAMDLIERVLVREGDTVVLEDPVYPGLRNLFAGGRARVRGVSVEGEGVDVGQAQRVMAAERPKLMIVTPNFQNPTGATLPAGARHALLRAARESQTVLVENDIYGQLRYSGTAPATVKQMDDSGNTLYLGSFSKVAFPGLRVGWVIGPRPWIAALAEAKQSSDLHTDQLSQAVLLRFSESARLAAHLRQVLVATRERLTAVLEACAAELPEGTTFTRPQGGMNLWVELPRGLNTEELLARAQTQGVSYLPGKYFSVSRSHSHCLRLSFAGLAPVSIRRGIAILGRLLQEELKGGRQHSAWTPAPALV
jgi:2-aminoadipate transaminase